MMASTIGSTLVTVHDKTTRGRRHRGRKRPTCAAEEPLPRPAVFDHSQPINIPQHGGPSPAYAGIHLAAVPSHFHNINNSFADALVRATGPDRPPEDLADAPKWLRRALYELYQIRAREIVESRGVLRPGRGKGRGSKKGGRRCTKRKQRGGKRRSKRRRRTRRRRQRGGRRRTRRR